MGATRAFASRLVKDPIARALRVPVPPRRFLLMPAKSTAGSMTSSNLSRFCALCLAFAVAAGPAWSQGAPSAGAQTAPPATGGRSTLVPQTGDPVDVDEVTLPAKPAAVVSGSSSWDEGFENLKKAFQ